MGRKLSDRLKVRQGSFLCARAGLVLEFFCRLGVLEGYDEEPYEKNVHLDRTEEPTKRGFREGNYENM